MATGVRASAKAKTRDTLLDVAFGLAETTGLEGLSVNAVTEAAGVAKGTFFHHFKDRTSYLVALHRRFHDGILEEAQRAAAGMPSGERRLAAISTTYLDACIRNRGVRALIMEARGLLPIQAEITRRNDSTVEFLTSDFVALKWPSPSIAARLWIGANVECALIELERGRPEPQARAALLAMAVPPPGHRVTRPKRRGG
jgi:TetR/AcrR family transcriptional regulator, transcriptional repressor for nem operon